MNKIIVTVLIALAAIQVFGQGLYSVNLKNEAAYISSGGGLFGVSFAIGKNKTNLSADDIAKLNVYNINKFDRSAALNYSERAKKASDVGLLGSLAGGLVFASTIPLVNKQDTWANQASTLALLWFETNLINVGITEITKVSVKRIRPFAYNPNAPLDRKLNSDVRKSFFSGHTSISAANTFFMAKVFADYKPESNWKPVVWTTAAIIPAFTGFMRYKAGKHFPTDIITGYIVGASIGYLIPELHKISAKNAASQTPDVINSAPNVPTFNFTLRF